MAKTTKKPTAKQLAARKKFAAMAKARAKTKKTAVKKAKVYQTGTSKVLVDKKKKAKSPGKRVSKGGANQYGVSKGGNVYYERRKNRSDMPGSLTGIGALKKTALSDCQYKLGKLHAAKLQETTKRGKAALQKQINEVNKKVKQLGKL